MATGPSVRIEGTANLRRTLIDAGASLDDLKAVNQAIEDMLVPLIVARAPRGKTGRLASSIRGSGTKTAAVTRAGSRRVPYARPIHWGWPARHIAPNRFAWDVVKSEQPRWTGQYRDAVDRVLARVKGV